MILMPGFSPYQSVRLSRKDAVGLARGMDMQRREFITLLGGAAVRGRSLRARSRRTGCG